MNKLTELLKKRESIEQAMQQPASSPLVAELATLDEAIAQAEAAERAKEIQRLDKEIQTLVKDAEAAQLRLLAQAEAINRESQEFQARYSKLMGAIQPYQDELSLFKATPAVGTISAMSRTLQQFTARAELRASLAKQ